MSWVVGFAGHPCCHDVGIQDEEGAFIADVADKENAPLLACAPDLLAFVQAVADEKVPPESLSRLARELIRKAAGS